MSAVPVALYGGVRRVQGGRSHHPLSLCRPQERALHHPTDGRQVSAPCSQPSAVTFPPPQCPRWAKGGDPVPVTTAGTSPGVSVCVCLCTGGGLRARFNILLYPVLPSTAASGAQGAPQVHGTEVLSARHSHQGSPRAAGMGSGCSAQPFGRGGGLLTPCHPASWTRVCPSPRAWSTQGASGEHQWGQNRNNSNFVSPHLMHPAAWTCPSWPRRPRRSCKR